MKTSHARRERAKYDRIVGRDSEIERVIQIHHRMTVIHAFRDGNGRTTRAFANMLLLKRNVSPVFFRDKEKMSIKKL